MDGETVIHNPQAWGKTYTQGVNLWISSGESCGKMGNPPVIHTGTC